MAQSDAVGLSLSQSPASVICSEQVSQESRIQLKTPLRIVLANTIRFTQTLKMKMARTNIKWAAARTVRGEPRSPKEQSVGSTGLRGETCGIPHLAKNERDVGHPAWVRGIEPKSAFLAPSTCHRQASLLKSETWATHSGSGICRGDFNEPRRCVYRDKYDGIPGSAACGEWTDPVSSGVRYPARACRVLPG
jgi:hypothetical protein